MIKLKGSKGMKHHKPTSKWQKFHGTLIVIIVGLILVCAAVNIWYYKTTQASIAATEQATQEMIKEADEQIKQIEADKAAQELARQEEAQKLAEQAKTGETDADSVDAKVCNPSKSHNNPASIDVVVNKKHCIQPLSYVPGDLVTINGATLSNKAAPAFSKLFAAAATAGQGFYVSSSYRSYDTQVATYAHWVSVSGKEAADTYSARPGYSEHQTGFAFDVAANGCTLDCFGSTTQYKWFQQHAADYGFIQRYYAGYEEITGYKAEEWHYRYVGQAVAQDMKAKNIKTLEQYWSISGGDY